MENSATDPQPTSQPTPAEDPALSTLRERTLRFWLQAAQQKPNITAKLNQGAIVKGTFVATDSENNRFRINGLQTPMGVYERAVIRGTDVDVLEIELGDDPIEGKTLKQ